MRGILAGRHTGGVRCRDVPFMSAGRIHSPHTGNGRNKRIRPTSTAPRGVQPSWPTLGSMPANSLGLRRKAKRQHPDCATDKQPHRAIVTQWLRDGFTHQMAEDFVRTRFPSDTLYIRALDIYRKMPEPVVSTGSGTVSFPLTAGDLRKARASSILESIE